ncbi:ran-interacting Mog1 protein [Aureobasidium sp. EXF-8845]|nr:ran-interacting Mog1 protein [Aureobasidium sp. EXF-8845]KAI4836124.1 ran-interacting Mog1 protein [Aureobasidium sp. EXF-8846]
MTVDLPSNFADVRQVPDNQEVYLDKDGLSSIVFDILERVDKPDLDALKYHLEDVVEDDADATKLWTSKSAVLSKLPPQTPAYTLFATHKASPEAISRGKAPDFTGILLTLIRLEHQKTDLVICVNVPHVDGEYNKNDVDPSAGKQGPMLDAATSFRDRILQSFEIKDWELFVQE